MTKIRLLLVEDNRLLREGLTAMLNEQPDIEVVAAFGNGKEAVLKATQELKPQIILLDSGIEGAKQFAPGGIGQEGIFRDQSDCDGPHSRASGCGRVRKRRSFRLHP